MAAGKSPLDLRAELATVVVNGGPKGAVEVWLDTIDPAVREQLDDIMRDPTDTTGHTKIAKLINERLGGPKFSSDKVAVYRNKIGQRA